LDFHEHPSRRGDASKGTYMVNGLGMRRACRVRATFGEALELLSRVIRESAQNVKRLSEEMERTRGLSRPQLEQMLQEAMEDDDDG
jgi:hypothetical protein